MGGHSHWSTIKHKKAAADQKRGKIFSKLTRAIMVAARYGADPEMNIRLRHAIEKAREFSVPRDNIERAIKRGSGEVEGAQFTETTYEGYGPGGVAMMVQALTDNLNRTTAEIRHIFEERGGKLGVAGSTAWMFKRKGLFGIPRNSIEEDKLIEVALEAGADDVVDAGSNWEVLCPPENFDKVKKALQAAGITPQVAELTLLADTEVELDPEAQKRMLSLMEALEEHDDVQNVYAAFTPSEEVVAEMSKG